MGNIPIPSDGTTSSHNIKEAGNAIRTNGERPRYDLSSGDACVPREVLIIYWLNCWQKYSFDEWMVFSGSRHMALQTTIGVPGLWEIPG
jgi:hypothetical protein